MYKSYVEHPFDSLRPISNNIPPSRGQRLIIQPTQWVVLQKCLNTAERPAGLIVWGFSKQLSKGLQGFLS